MKNSTLLKIARAMLERAAPTFSGHGCNDVNVARIIADPAERDALALAVEIWNGSPGDYDPEAKHDMGYDWLYMKFCAAMLGKQIKAAELAEAATKEIESRVAELAPPKTATPEDLDAAAGAPVIPGIVTGLDRETSDDDLRARLTATAAPIPLDVETHEVRIGTAAPLGFTIASASESGAEIATHAEATAKLAGEPDDEEPSNG